MDIYKNILKYICSYGESAEDHTEKHKRFVHDN